MSEKQTVGLKTIDFNIGDFHYRHTLLGGLAGRGLYVKLQKAILPSLARVHESTVVAADGSVVSAPSFGEMAGAILDGLNPELFESLCNAMAGKTALVSINQSTGQENIVRLSDVFDMHFSGRYDSMLIWLIECVKANRLADFLSQSDIERLLSVEVAASG